MVCRSKGTEEGRGSARGSEGKRAMRWLSTGEGGKGEAHEDDRWSTQGHWATEAVTNPSDSRSILDCADMQDFVHANSAKTRANEARYGSARDGEQEGTRKTKEKEKTGHKREHEKTVLPPEGART
eukprot:3134962-Pleurochrysis_carterae.AAC.2